MFISYISKHNAKSSLSLKYPMKNIEKI